MYSSWISVLVFCVILFMGTDWVHRGKSIRKRLETKQSLGNDSWDNCLMSKGRRR